MKTILAVIASSLLCLLSGGVLGMLIAGNYTTELRFFEYRGYEAGMYWGGIAGVFLGTLLGTIILLARQYFKSTRYEGYVGSFDGTTHQ